jgi:hypothetical protein
MERITTQVRRDSRIDLLLDACACGSEATAVTAAIDIDGVSQWLGGTKIQADSEGEKH